MDPPDVERRAAAGKDAALGVVPDQRLERAERDENRVVRRAGREAEQPLLLGLAQVAEGVGADEGVADAPTGERRARATQRDQPPVLREQRRVPGLRAVP